MITEYVGDRDVLLHACDRRRPFTWRTRSTTRCRPWGVGAPLLTDDCARLYFYASAAAGVSSDLG
jgi:hypothetical protein